MRVRAAGAKRPAQQSAKRVRAASAKPTPPNGASSATSDPAQQNMRAQGTLTAARRHMREERKRRCVIKRAI